MRSYLDGLEIDFLNTPLLRDLGLSTYRILGPNFHFISFAYVLAFFSVSWLRSAGGGTSCWRCRCCSWSGRREP